MEFIKIKIYLTLFFTLFLCSAALADAITEGETSFSFTDIFRFDEPVRKPDDTKKWFLNISGGYTGKQGNTNSINSSFGSFIKYDDSLTVFKLSYSGSYGKFAGVVNENKGTATANFDYYLLWRIEFFSYTMSDYNKITLLKHRNGSGAGAKVYIIRNKYFLVDLSGAPILQYEKYEQQPAKEDWRWSIRGRVEIFPFSDNFYIKYYAFYIPAIADKRNFRTIQELTLNKKIAESLAIKAGYRRDYNTYDKKSYIDNPNLKRTDSTTYIQASLTL